uniref:ubiquitinyl hydrolase 1 n=1 Tax=Bos mutus grunniens TaxID=30521 RepID=A0A8B9Z164_BOSMU
LWATRLRARGPHPAGEDGGGAGPGGGACPGAGPGRPGKTEAPNLGVAAGPGSRSTTFSGAGHLETAGEKTRLPEAFAFFDARARDAAAVGRASGEERPQTESSEFLRPRLAGSRSLSPRSSSGGHGVSAPELQRLHRSGLSQVPQRLPVVLVLQRVPVQQEPLGLSDLFKCPLWKADCLLSEPPGKPVILPTYQKLSCLPQTILLSPRYVNGHAKKHYEDAQIPLTNHKKSEKQEKAQHTVCMDCSSYSTYCYRCDDFVVNDTKLGLVQKVREHLQNLENSAFTADRHRKRKLLENSSLNSKLLKVNGSTTAICATGLRNLGNTCFMNAILQSLSNIEQFCCYFKELPAVELRNGKTAGRRTYHTRSQGENNVSLVEEFRKTLCALWQGSQTAFSPESLFYVVWKIMPNFRGYQQQDAHEFMRYLLDHLHLELQGGFNGISRSSILQENSTLSASNKCCM